MFVQWGLRYRNVSWAVRLGLAVMVISSPAAQAADIDTALLPGETFMAMSNCGVILGPDAVESWINNGKTEADLTAKYQTMVWTGECKYGLAHGTGWSKDSTADTAYKLPYTLVTSYWYGRSIGGIDRVVNEQCTQMSRTLKSGERIAYPVVNSRLVLGADMDTLGTCSIDDGFGGLRQLASLDYRSQDGVVTSASVFDGTCVAWGYKTEDMPFRCEPGEREFAVRGVELTAFDPKSKEIKHLKSELCPDSKSRNGCEEVWNKLAGDLVEKIKKLHEQYTVEVETDKQRYTKAIEPYLAELKAEQAQREAAAIERERVLRAAEEADRLQAQQEQLEREAQNAVDQAAQEKAAKEKAAAQQKAREKETQALQAKLNKMNHGELFAYADEQIKIGDRDSAIQVLRLLVSKYPNSPLVAVAAQQLAQLKPLTEQEKAKLQLGPSK